MSLALHLHNTCLQGGQFISDLSASLSKWRHTTRRIGGYWTATADYVGDRSDLDEIFFSGLMKEITATYNGFRIWQGFLGEMTYMRDGATWIQSIYDVANAVRALYIRLGDQMLTNGSAESGAWTAVNGATVTQDTAWVSDGNYSCKIVSAGGIRGADIQTSITIVAEAAYDVRVDLHVDSGSWRIAVNRTDTDGKIAAKSTKGQQGDVRIQFSIPVTNLYAGTVRFRITSENAAGTIWGDGAVMQLAPQPASTNWKIDTPSLNEYGRIERILLLPPVVSSGANARAQTVLDESAWPVTQSPPELEPASTAPDKLSLSFYGYIFALRWRYSTLYSTDTMSNIVRAACAQQSDYILPGIIDDNATEFQIDNSTPYSLWKALSEIAASGDENGARWALGVYNDRKLHYQPVPDELSYHLQAGIPYSAAGGDYEPALVLPGWAQFDDAPRGPASLASNANRVPRRTYFEEIEYIAETNRVIFRRQAGSDNA
jgi:hypothetical protein